jgi:hypothetical protein
MKMRHYHLLAILYATGKLQSEIPAGPLLAGIPEFACDHHPVKWASGFTKENEGMLSAQYDILKKDAASVVWVEAVQNLETAILRAEKSAAESLGEFDQHPRKIVANCGAPRRF